MDDDKIKSIKHSAGAAILIIVVFMLCVYVIEPIINNIFITFGKFFVQERFGGGSLSHEKSLLQHIIWFALTIYLSFYVAYSAASKYFIHQSKKITFIFICIFLVLFAISIVSLSKSNSNNSGYYINSQLNRNINTNDPIYYNSPAILFTVIDSCDDGYDIQYKFLDLINNMYWPSKDQVYITRGLNVPELINLKCDPNAIICFGARSIGAQFSWGLGLDFISTDNNEVDASCFPCNNVHESTQRMICNSASQ